MCNVIKQRIKQKPPSSDTTSNYGCHLLLCSWTDSTFYISPRIAAPFTYKIASSSILPHYNKHTMKWLWDTDGASRVLPIFIFSQSAGRKWTGSRAPNSRASAAMPRFAADIHITCSCLFVLKMYTLHSLHTKSLASCWQWTTSFKNLILRHSPPALVCRIAPTQRWVLCRYERRRIELTLIQIW